MNHRSDARLLHTGERGVKTDSGESRYHKELAYLLSYRNNIGGNVYDTCYDGHSEEAEYEVGEYLLYAEARLDAVGGLGVFLCFLALKTELYEGEGDNRGNYC